MSPPPKFTIPLQPTQSMSAQRADALDPIELPLQLVPVVGLNTQLRALLQTLQALLVLAP